MSGDENSPPPLLPANWDVETRLQDIENFIGSYFALIYGTDNCIQGLTCTDEEVVACQLLMSKSLKRISSRLQSR